MEEKEPPQDSDQKNIDMTSVIEKWDKRLKSAEVGNREYNLQCLLAHTLGVQAVKITFEMILKLTCNMNLL